MATASKKEIKMDMAVEPAEKQPKKMVRFKETDEDRPITLYLRKSQVDSLGGNVEDIEVIVRRKS